MKTKITSVEIVDMIEACPYCEKEKNNKRVCCGEVHFEPAFVLVDGSLLFESQMQANQKPENKVS
jgi:hypothetical protein